MSIWNRLFGHMGIAVVGALAASGCAGAAVTTWNCNLSIPANSTGYFINVDARTFGTANVPGWDLQIYSDSAAPSIVFYCATNAGIQKGTPPFGLPAANLADCTVVGPSSPMTLGGPLEATFSVPTNGVWYLNAVNYFGFKFQAADGFVHYGYGTMTVGANANIRTLNSLTYDTTPGVAVTVECPAPGALALVGLCGLSGKRRRR